MRKIYTIVQYIAFAAVFAGCSLDRGYLNGPSTGTFPASEEEAIAGVLVSYKNLGNGAFQQQYSPFPYRFLDNVTDIGCHRSAALGTWAQLEQSTMTSQNSYASDLYSGIYKTAGRIHLVLDNLGKLEDKISPETYGCIKAELLCLRAYVYNMGCQFYGDIPFIDHCLSLDDYAYPRMKKEEVIRKILEEDLKDEILDYLPVQWPKSEWGTVRIGRAAAYTLKARICLHWGRYAEAAIYSKKAMDMSDGIYSLTPLDGTYYATAMDGEPDQTPLFGFNAEGINGSKEWMWSISFNKLAASNVHHAIYTLASRVSNGAASCGPTQAFMDSFQCTDGKSIVESDKYNWQNPWKNRDPRLDLYCVRSDSRVMGIEMNTSPSRTTVHDYIAGTDLTNADVTGNKSEYGPNGKSGPGGYLWRKFTDPLYHGAINGASYEDDLDMPIIRYAELLLIDAEANIEMTGGDLNRAADDIDAIRARAHMPKIDRSSVETIRKALRYERKIELCNEGFRWFDLLRWKDAKGSCLAATAVDGVQLAPPFDGKFSNAIPTIDDNWIVSYEGQTWDGKTSNLRTLRTLKFTEKRDELWPFPYTELTTNPKIGPENQNPGY